MNQLVILALSGGWIQFIQFFVALSILIIIHEAGHYWAARLTGTRVEKFYLFFDFLFPWPGLLNFSLFKKKVGDTEFGLGWFPFGGYVNIAGMVDESTNSDELSREPKPDEFRAKSAPQRLLIMIGGILMNIILALLAYTFLFKVYGESRMENAKIPMGIATDSVLEKAGFQNHDRIIAFDNKKVKYFDRLAPEFIFSTPKTATVLRDGKEVTFNIPEGTIANLLSRRKGIFKPHFPFIVAGFGSNTVLDSNKITKGCEVVAIDNQPVKSFFEFENYKLNTLKWDYDNNKSFLKNLEAWRDANKKPRIVTFLKDGKDTITFTGLPNADASFGVIPNLDIDSLCKGEKINYSILGALGRSCSYSWQKIVDNVMSFKALLGSKEVKAKDSLGGFASMTQIFPKSFDLESFLQLLCFISLSLAFMNFLPIPGLDGGYIMFLLWEMITGKKVSDKVIEKANGIGLLLILGLMLYANGLDVWRWLGK